MKKIYTLSLFIMFCFIMISNKPAGSGELSGRVTDEKNEAIPFANVTLKLSDSIVTDSQTDFDGFFSIKPLQPGKYNVEVSSVGHSTSITKDVIINADKITTLNTQLKVGVELDIVEVVYNRPLIDAENTSTKKTVDQKEIAVMPARNVQSISSTSAGVYHLQNGHSLNVRGSRSEATEYYIDGIRVRGSVNLPKNSSTIKNDESYETHTENEFKKAKQIPLSTFSIDVDVASYSNVRRFLMSGQKPPVDAVRIEELINYFTYDYNNPSGEHPFSVFTEVSACPWNENNKLVHIGIQGKKIETDKLPKSSLTFLIDVSGSMQSENKLELVKKSLRLLVNQLKEDDRIAIVVYAGASGIALPSTTCKHKEQIIEALDRLQAGGSTAGSEGIMLAYKVAKENLLKDGNNRVILCTDGDFNVGVTSNSELENLIVEKRNEGIFLSVLGFGMGNYKDDKMEILADKGNGNYAYIDNLLEANKVLVKQMGATLFTIAKDVKIQVEFNPVNVKAYRLIGYENRLLNDEDFNDDKKDAGELGAGSTVTALYEIITDEKELEKLSRVDSLKYQRNVVVNDDSMSNELLTLKLRYKKPDEHKSILLSEVVRNKQSDIENASANLKFSSSVAMFGMLLRDSKFKGNSSFDSVVKLANLSKGNDTDGYRSEFVRLVELASSIK